MLIFPERGPVRPMDTATHVLSRLPAELCAVLHCGPHCAGLGRGKAPGTSRRRVAGRFRRPLRDAHAATGKSVWQVGKAQVPLAPGCVNGDDDSDDSDNSDDDERTSHRTKPSAAKSVRNRKIRQLCTARFASKRRACVPSRHAPTDVRRGHQTRRRRRWTSARMLRTA